MENSAPHQQTASPNDTAKLSQHSPQDAHEWSADDRSSDEDANDRSQNGTSNKRKRPLSVSCETCSKSSALSSGVIGDVKIDFRRAKKGQVR
jgi:hypothetical protein